MPVNKENKMTGYASIDKPWLKYYSKDAINAEFPKCSIYENIYKANKEYDNEITLIYYGNIMAQLSRQKFDVFIMN